MKKIVIAIQIVVVVIVVMLYLINFNKNEVNSIIDQVDIFKNIDYITEREKYVLDNNVSFGNSLRELENEYYDIKISKENEKIIISINLLSKDITISNYSQEYVDEFCKYLYELFNKKINILTLKDIICEKYTMIRDRYDYFEVEKVEYDDNEIHIEIFEEDNMIKIVIGDRG